jgi:hypothetical protein
VPRFPSAALPLLLLLSACKVERTPPEFYSHNAAAAIEQKAAEDELRSRVGAFREALSRGNPGAAVLALSPTPEAVVLGLEDRPAPSVGAAGLAAAMAEMGPAARGGFLTPDLAVDVNVRRNTGWFSTHLIPETPGAGAPLRMSGVFLLDKGEWKLVQAHFSRPAPVPAPADTLAAGRDTTATDSASRRPEPVRPAGPRR